VRGELTRERLIESRAGAQAYLCPRAPPSTCSAKASRTPPFAFVVNEYGDIEGW
jgi:hypothetical protein